MKVPYSLIQKPGNQSVGNSNFATVFTEKLGTMQQFLRVINFLHQYSNLEGKDLVSSVKSTRYNGRLLARNLSNEDI